MTDERNKSYITYVPQIGANWQFFIPVSATTVSEEVEEFLEVTRQMTGTFEDFFRPRTAEGWLRTYGDELSLELPLADPMTYEPEQEGPITVSDPDRLGFSQISETFREAAAPPERGPYIRELEFDGPTRFWIDGQDHYVNAGSSDVYRAWSRTDDHLYDEPEQPDPLSVDLYHTCFFPPESPDETYYKINVGTMCDVWFADTETGRHNRERLASFIERLRTDLDIVGFRVSAEKCPKDTMIDIAGMEPTEVY